MYVYYVIVDDNENLNDFAIMHKHHCKCYYHHYHYACMHTCMAIKLIPHCTETAVKNNSYIHSYVHRSPYTYVNLLSLKN